MTGGVPFTARSLTRSMFKGHDEDTDTIIAPRVAAILTPGDEAKHTYAGDGGTLNIVAHALRAEGADASEDGTGRGTPIVIQDARGVREKVQHGIGITEDGPCYTLDSVSQHAVMFSDPRRHDVRGIHRGDVREKPSLNATNNDLLLCGAPRRITPREAERLQGFPTDWTLIEGASDSARYRALGNAVAVPVVEWILRRIPAETVGELFAGIGGCGLAALRAGRRVVWASEIDPFCRKVYATRFPDVELLGDVRKVASDV